MNFTRILLHAFSAALLVTAPLARAVFPQVALKPLVLQQIHSPTTITYAPDGSGRVFICDQPGKIYIFESGMLRPTPFLDVTSRTVTQNAGYNERGLLGLTFHPGYATPSSPGYRKFYVYYNKTYVAGTDPAPPQTGDPVTSVTVVAEYQVSAGDPNVADATSERRLLLFTRPQSNHNGGMLEFGPEVGPAGERYLYIGSGDGGSQMDNNVGHTGGSGARPNNNLGNGQDKTRYLGKILRIDPLGNDGPGGQYGIPASNPFVNDLTPGIKKEIYSYGMRNPWRFSFDKRPGGTNRLFCGDVGGARVEEVDLIVAGGNYGWRYKEGTEFPSFSSGAATDPMTLPPSEVAAMIDPIAMYAHSNLPANDPTTLPKLGLSITGGFVYRGAAIPAMQGQYVFGDYGSTSGASDGRMMGLEETAPMSGVFTLTQALPLVHAISTPNIAANYNSNPIVGQRILCMGEDESGELYVAMKTQPGVLQLDNGFPSGGIYKIVPVTSGTLAVNPSKDNSMFADYTDNSSAKGVTLFAGVTSTAWPRRALMAFDVSSAPAGAAVSSAQVQLTVSTGQGLNTPMALYRVTQSWGEATSNAGEAGGTGVPAATGDATWNARLFDPVTPTLWTTPGGDYIPSASASASVSSNATYTWTSAQLASDVQGWVTTPSTNNGWILIGDEINTFNAKRVRSREWTTAAERPKLTINYATAPPPTHYESWVALYFPTNLVGQYINPNGDLDGDGIANQLEYAFGFSPGAKNNMSDGLSGLAAPAGGGGTNYDISFRRDAAATDLTYFLQTSTDLNTWTTIAQSTTGAAPVGLNGGVILSDATVTGAIKLVTARQFLPAGSNDKKFVRLRVDRF